MILNIFKSSLLTDVTYKMVENKEALSWIIALALVGFFTVLFVFSILVTIFKGKKK